MKPVLSIVVPIWNEAQNIRPLTMRIDAALQPEKTPYEVIFVDDFSTDGSLEQIKILAEADGYPVKVFTKEGSRGKAISLLQGFEKAEGDILVMIDGDLQYPPEALPVMLEKIKAGSDVVVTSRTSHKESMLRAMLSKLFLFLFIHVLHGLSLDSQSGLKMFTRRAIAAFPINPSPWTFDLEFLLNSKQFGYAIDSVDIDFAERVAGESKINVLKASWELASNAVKLKLRRLFSDKPVTPFTAEELAEKGKGFYYGGKELVHHTDLSHHETAHLVITKMQKIILSVLVLLLASALLFNWHGTLLVLFAALTILYFIDLVFNFFLIFRTFVKNPAIKIAPQAIAKIPESEWPTYTIFCPLYKEWQVVPQFIDAMSKLDYPKDKLQVMLLLEADDTKTIEKTKEFNLPSYFDVVVVPHSYPKTKPKAMNYGLQFATGEHLVIYDAEDVPDPLQLKKAVLAFKKLPDNVVCVQAKLNFYNPDQNLLTRLFTAEYSLWFDLVLTGLQSLNGPIPLGGTSNHFRTKDLRILKGWDAFNVTEDCDLGVRLFKRGYRTAIVESTTLEEANSDLKNWYHQRSRWIKGYIQTYLVHMRRPGEFMDDLRRPHVLTFQLNVGGKILSMFINPVMWMITVVYFAFRSQVGPFIETFFPSGILYLGVFSFIFGNFLYLYYYLIGCAKRGQFGLIKYALLVPFYWLAMSVAAWRAVYEIIAKPHYWAKTIHGLHLQKSDIEEAASEQQFVLESVGINQAPIPPTPPSVLSEPTEAVTVVETVSLDSGSIVATEIEVQTKRPGLLTRIRAFRGSMISDGAWYVVAVVVSNFLNFVFNAFLGRTLELEDFAIVTLFGTMLGLVFVVLSALAATVNYKTAFLLGEGKTYSAKVFTEVVFKKWFWISTFAMAFWIAVTPLIAQFFQINQLYLVLSFSPVFLFGTLAAVTSGYLRGKFLFRLLGWALIAEALVKLLAAGVFIMFGYPELVSVSIPISILVSFIATWAYARRAMKQDETVERITIENDTYSFPNIFFRATLLTTAAAAVFLSIDVLLAKHYLTPDDAGSYSLLSLVGKMVFFFGSLLSSFIISLVSRHEGAKTSSAQDFYKLFNGTVLCTLVAFLGVGVFGRFTVPILLGDQSRIIVPYLVMYCAAMSLYTLTVTLVSYHVAKKEYEFSWISLAGAVLMGFGVYFRHNTIADFVNALFFASAIQAVVVFGWHALRKNTRFILRTVTDFFDIFVPLAKPAPLAVGKRILIFNWRDTKHAYAGGAEVYIHELAKRWVESGNQVTVFAGNDGESSKNDVVDGVRIVRRGGFYFVYAWAFFYYMFQFRGRFDVVIDCQNGIPFFTPLYVKEPVYCLMHHVHQEVFRKYLIPPLAFIARMLESKAMPIVYRDTQFITISDSSKAEMESLGIGLAGMEIVHPGVNLQDLIPGEKDPQPLVLYLGRLKAYKSVDVLIRAFKKVLHQIPSARLVVAGGGEEEQVLRDLARDMAVEHRVTFTGKISEAEKISWLQRAWVFVNPSMMEGWGITSIEANACGVPVVASDVPGLRDSVHNPHTGYLVEHGDVDTFAARIIRVLEHKDIRDFMSKNGVEWASQFSWDVSAAKSLELISDYE